MSWLILFLGWLGVVTGNLFWIGHAIYQLVKTDMGFFTVLLSNLGFWVLHMLVSIIFIVVGIGMKSK